MPSLGEAHRQAQLALRAITLQEMVRLWPAFDPARADETFPAWAYAAAQVVLARRQQSVQIAAAYVQQQAAAVGVIQPRIVAALPLDAARLLGNLRISSVVAVKTAATRGVPAAQAGADAFVLSSGQATRLTLEGGRQTVTASANADHRARWARVASSGACEFCQALADDFSDVGQEDGADFEAHGHCGCTAEIEYAA